MPPLQQVQAHLVEQPDGKSTSLHPETLHTASASLSTCDINVSTPKQKEKKTHLAVVVADRIKGTQCHRFQHETLKWQIPTHTADECGVC